MKKQVAGNAMGKMESIQLKNDSCASLSKVTIARPMRGDQMHNLRDYQVGTNPIFKDYITMNKIKADGSTAGSTSGSTSTTTTTTTTTTVQS